MDNTQNWVNPTFNPRPAIQGNPWGRPAPQGVSRQDIPARPIPTPIPNPAPIPTPAPAPAPASTTNAIPSIPTPRPRQMSLSERLEMLRVDMEARLNEHGFVGFQVVRREFISHNFDPAMTVRENSVTFNNACISKLEDARYIQFLINPEEQKLIIRPCEEGDRDAVRWCITKQDKRKSRQITCRDFTERLYELMGWETVYRYKLQGVGINYQGEKMYLFDLQSKEAFAPQRRDPNTGKVVRPKAELPEEWAGSFGMSVEEHDQSTNVDLNAGYVEAETHEGDGYGQENAASPDAPEQGTMMDYVPEMAMVGEVSGNE